MVTSNTSRRGKSASIWRASLYFRQVKQHKKGVPISKLLLHFPSCPIKTRKHYVVTQDSRSSAHINLPCNNAEHYKLNQFIQIGMSFSRLYILRSNTFHLSRFYHHFDLTSALTRQTSSRPISPTSRAI